MTELNTSAQDLVAEFDRMMLDAAVFSDVAMKAHLEVLSVEQLPHLREQRGLCLVAIEEFADEPFELGRLYTVLAFINRQIAHLEQKGAKQK